MTTPSKKLLLSFKEYVKEQYRETLFTHSYADLTNGGDQKEEAFVFYNAEGKMPFVGFVLGSMVPIWVEKGFKIIQAFAKETTKQAKHVILRGFSRGAVAVLLLLKKLSKHNDMFKHITFEVEVTDPVPGNSPLGACFSAFGLNTSLANQLDLIGLDTFLYARSFKIRHRIYTSHMSILAPIMARWMLPKKLSKILDDEKKGDSRSFSERYQKCNHVGDLEGDKFASCLSDRRFEGMTIHQDDAQKDSFKATLQPNQKWLVIWRLWMIAHPKMTSFLFWCLASGIAIGVFLMSPGALHHFVFLSQWLHIGTHAVVWAIIVGLMAGTVCSLVRLVGRRWAQWFFYTPSYRPDRPALVSALVGLIVASIVVMGIACMALWHMPIVWLIPSLPKLSLGLFGLMVFVVATCLMYRWFVYIEAMYRHAEPMNWTLLHEDGKDEIYINHVVEHIVWSKPNNWDRVMSNVGRNFREYVSNLLTPLLVSIRNVISRDQDPLVEGEAKQRHLARRLFAKSARESFQSFNVSPHKISEYLSISMINHCKDCSELKGKDVDKFVDDIITELNKARTV